MIVANCLQTADAIVLEGGDGSGLSGTGAARFATEAVTISKQEYIELKASAARYRELHARSLKREEELKREVEQLKATVRDLQQRLYGKQSEKSCAGNEKQPDSTKKKPGVRGHRVGHPGHGRKPSPSLPVREQIVDVPDDQKQCVNCKKPYSAWPKIPVFRISAELHHYRAAKFQASGLVFHAQATSNAFMLI